MRGAYVFPEGGKDEVVRFILAQVSQSPEPTLVDTGLTNTQVRTAKRTFVLKVTAGSASAEQILVGGREVILGSDPSCEFVLRDPKVSRKHLSLQVVAEGLRVRDLGSTNGTFLDGVRVMDSIAPATSAIRVGDVQLRAFAAPSPTIDPSKRTRFGGLVGESLGMREVFAILERASPTEATVLIQGESGTGKEIAARAIHDHSRRASGPFVVFDCAAASEQLLESQIFGHKKGAFTNSITDRLGAFAAANDGTIFLDEIGELPLPAQMKLLRALESRTVQPLGSDEPVAVDTRLVAATHRDLVSMVDQGAFRADLFHRLAVVHLSVPSLRDHLDDLPCLIRTFYEGTGVDPGPIDGENLDLLARYPWPGNIRELKNTIERAWVMGGVQPFAQLELTMGAMAVVQPDIIDIHLPFKEAKERLVASFERRYLAAVMELCGNSIQKAADHAQIHRNHFTKLIDAYGLRKK
jgi:DNA-binding NtrC family response regulator